ncbi:MAG: MFS transporter [Acidobacteriota bacterium]|nr:MFS transporter [Acidobacteriota bacterium]
MNRRALFSVCIAGFAFSANYTNHAPMVGALRTDFGFSQASAGLLTTGIFLTHAIMQIPGGRLSDRLGASRVMVVAMAWVALANVAIAFSGAYWQLLLCKTIAGIGTGACFAAGARYVVAMFTGRTLHLAQGMYGASVVLGSGFVLFAVPQLLGAFGWRGAFLGCALLAAVTWFWWMWATPKTQQSVPAAGSLGEMMVHRELWLLGWMQMASFGMMIVVGAWITTLLKTSFELPLKTAGGLGSMVLLLGIVSRPLGGWLAHFITIRSLIGASLLLNALACTALGWGHSLGIAMAAIVALGIGCGVPYAGIFNRAAALFPSRAGAAMGFVNMVGIVMILAGAPAVGYLADLSGQFQTSFYVLSVFSLLAAAAPPAIPEGR